MKYPYNLELATTDIDAALEGFARTYKGGHVKNASASGNEPATHYLCKFPLPVHMKEAFVAMDKTGLQYALYEGDTLLDEVEITVEHVVNEAE